MPLQTRDSLMMGIHLVSVYVCFNELMLTIPTYPISGKEFRMAVVYVKLQIDSILSVVIL